MHAQQQHHMQGLVRKRPLSRRACPLPSHAHTLCRLPFLPFFVIPYSSSHATSILTLNPPHTHTNTHSPHIQATTMAPSVTPQTVERIYAGQKDFKPTVQVRLSLSSTHTHTAPDTSSTQPRRRMHLHTHTHSLPLPLLSLTLTHSTTHTPTHSLKYTHTPPSTHALNKQVLDVKKIQPNPGQAAGSERFRLIISDGIYFQQAMLATQLNPLVNDGLIAPNALITLDDFICNEVQGKKIVIILKCDVASSNLGYKVGDPVEYGKPANTNGSSAAPFSGANANAGGGYQAGAASRPPHQTAPTLNTMAGASVPYQAGGAAAAAAPMGGGGGGYHACAGVGRGGYRQQSAPVVRHDISANIIPINDLNPYQHRWMIKARLTNKSDIKRWSNAKGEGTLFSIDLLDEQGGEIRCTFFKEACERFHPMLEQGKVYTFSGGRLKVAQRQFSSIRNEYEITFDANSEIVPVEDDHSIQSAVYAFRKIADIEQVGVWACIYMFVCVMPF